MSIISELVVGGESTSVGGDFVGGEMTVNQSSYLGGWHSHIWHSASSQLYSCYADTVDI